jgi:hypothetical protein
VDLAHKLADWWYDAREGSREDTTSYHALRQALSHFLPADAIAGIAYFDDRPLVLALPADVLIAFAPSEPDQEIEAIALPVAAVHGLSVTCRHEAAMHANYRACTWTLHTCAGAARSYVTRRVIGNGFETDKGGEAVMLALADRLGWTAPLHLENAGNEWGLPA